MTRTRIGLAIGLALAALAVSGCGGDDDDAAATDTETATTLPGTVPEAGETLTASVGPGFEISLTGSDGAAVTTLPAGSYTIQVDDQSDMHNFHLTGPGVEETTDVAEVGTATWEVTFEAGSYQYVCDPHASTMNGSFEVT